MSQRLGLDVYSLRSQGWDAFELLEYAARLGLDNVHYSERGFLGAMDAPFLGRLRTRADELGVSIEVGMRSIDHFAKSFDASLGTGEEQLGQMIDAALVLGSPVVRCFMGMAGDRLHEVGMRGHLEEIRRVLRAIAPRAREAGVKIALENHGFTDLTARELRWVIEEAGPDHVGACIDTGNPTYGCEDPLLTAEVLAEYAVSSHVRDSAVWEVEDGAMAQWTVLGQGNVDVRGVLKLLAEKAPECPVDLEVITGGQPRHLPYLRPDAELWRMYSDVPARDFARFVGLAKRGSEPAPRAADQLKDFEASVRYAREELGLGTRGRA